VDEVHIVTAEIVLAIFACVTALLAILASVIDPEPIVAVGVTSTHEVPLYSHVLSPDVNVCPFVGEFGKSIGIYITT
jgi:hypothetical protein